MRQGDQQGEYDFFVSFAHDDNKMHASAPCGWVSMLHQTLLIELKRTRYGRKHGVKGFFSERNMDATIPLGDQIFDILPRTRLLVVILSDSYLGSDWCRDERKAFLEAVRQHPFERQRIVLIDLGTVAHEEKPDALGPLLGVPFYYESDGSKRTLGYPYPLATNVADRPFFNAVSDVARKMAERLEQLRESDAAQIKPDHFASENKQTMIHGLFQSAMSGTKTIFLAEATDDLYHHREGIAADLKQHGIRVVPEEPLSSDLATCRSEIEKAFAESMHFVQILGEFSGKKLRGGEESAVLLQCHLARERGLKVLQWRPEAIDPAKSLDGPYRDLLMHAEVRTGKLEQFQRELRELFAPPKREIPVSDATSAGTVGGQRPLVLVSNDVKDEQEAERLWRVLKSDLRFRSRYCQPSDDPTEETTRREMFNELLLECDGLVLLYGQVKQSWVEQQEAALWKLNARRTKPLRVTAICVSPPANRPMYEPDDPDIVPIDCREGLSVDQLRSVLASLSGDSSP